MNSVRSNYPSRSELEAILRLVGIHGPVPNHGESSFMENRRRISFEGERDFRRIMTLHDVNMAKLGNFS